MTVTLMEGTILSEAFNTQTRLKGGLAKSNINLPTQELSFLWKSVKTGEIGLLILSNAHTFDAKTFVYCKYLSST